MTDTHSVTVRSYNMSQIRSKDTKPELLVRKFLHERGFRYKLHDKTLPGKPDLVLPKFKTLIFVNGCFWHGHNNCRFFVIPKTRTEWWTKKLLGNVHKDQRNIKSLKKQGWKIIVIWECELKKDTQIRLKKLINQLKPKIKDSIRPNQRA